MAEQTRKRRWPLRLLALALLVGAVALARDRQIRRNERRFAAMPARSTRP
jgi:hypothetical protein